MVADTLYGQARLAALRDDRNAAISLLRQAIEIGWAKRRITNETAFAPLRGTSEFEAILKKIESSRGSDP